MCVPWGRGKEKGWFQKMSRISSIERLQRGQVPLFNHSSLEHTLQNVCPHGMNAAPFFLPMHTQHTQSFPTASTAASPPSVSSNSRINDTLKGVPSPSRNWRSAASAAARFIPELDWLGPTCSGPVWFGSWPAFVSSVGLYRRCPFAPLTNPEWFLLLSRCGAIPAIWDRVDSCRPHRERERERERERSRDVLQWRQRKTDGLDAPLLKIQEFETKCVWEKKERNWTKLIRTK